MASLVIFLASIILGVLLGFYFGFKKFFNPDKFTYTIESTDSNERDKSTH